MRIFEFVCVFISSSINRYHSSLKCTKLYLLQVPHDWRQKYFIFPLVDCKQGLKRSLENLTSHKFSANLGQVCIVQCLTLES